jgi:N-acetylneuraminic acid mutarotase
MKMKKILDVILLGMMIALMAGCSSGGAGSTPTTFSISGTVSGDVAANVTINLASGVNNSTTTASDGTYSFTGLGNGNYTVTPVLKGYTFTPTTQVVTISGANITGQNFTSISKASTFIGMWTWESGSDTCNQTGSYSSLGSTDPGNVPGARASSVSWIDNGDNLWLFGGFGYDSAGNVDLLNDLWKFDGANWTWVSGSKTSNQPGSYGTLGSADAGNVPGARSSSVSWIDSSGNLWLFGGYDYDSAGNVDLLNDLWKFDSVVSKTWTWVSGSNTYNQVGSYGTLGSAGTGNVPGGRSSSVSWIDSSGNLWLFGGWGYDSAGNVGLLNDLWKFDSVVSKTWTWVSGSKTYGQVGSSVGVGVTAAGNVPGARSSSVSWIDSDGNLWLFGGWGYDSAGNVGLLNDLWKFDGVSKWTWISGSNTYNQAGSSVGVGVTAASNIPGARQYSVSWIDSSNNLWLFGGIGYDFAGNVNLLNDLWIFDGTNWTWLSGYGQTGSYGTIGVAATGNTPGARSRSVSWIDSTGKLWLFGGYDYDSATNDGGYLNDLWSYQP